jgi:ubiquinone/menaquinone biosynthesis C-methylase UbiE
MDRTNTDEVVARVRDYWQGHTLGKQFVRDDRLEPGTPEFFAHVRPWMTPFRFSEIMARIERESALLRGKRLLEIGCGMGFDSVEFLKRGVRVTSTDLTQAAVDLTRRHVELEGLEADDVCVQNALELSYPDGTFDAVWACGVLHHTGDTPRAIREVRRVLKPGGRAIISHLYRRPSWMYAVSRLGRENIEFKEEDAPVTDFFTESEVLEMFEGFEIEEATQDHYRALPISRTGLKAALYTWGFKPLYNLLPEAVARRYAYKFSVTAIKE